MSAYAIWESHFPTEAASQGRRVTERIWADMRGCAGYLGHELLQAANRLVSQPRRRFVARSLDQT
jgi:hypothetical protein